MKRLPRIHKNAHSGAQREKHEEHGGSTGVLAKYLRPIARDSQCRFCFNYLWRSLY
jgi:hypothetical protein